MEDEVEKEAEVVAEQPNKAEKDIELEKLDEMRRKNIKAKKAETEFELAFQQILAVH